MKRPYIHFIPGTDDDHFLLEGEASDLFHSNIGLIVYRELRRVFLGGCPDGIHYVNPIQPICAFLSRLGQRPQDTFADL